MGREAKTILMVLSVPPPYQGGWIVNYNILTSKKVNSEFNVVHLDISDKRNIDNQGKIDIINTYLALKHFISLFLSLERYKPDMVFLNIAQNKAFIRDGVFILIAKLFSKAKIVVHVQVVFGNYYKATNVFMKKFIDFVLPLVDTFIVLGEELKKGVIKWAKNIEVVPNGIDFFLDFKRKYKEKEFINISYLGYFFREKGVLDLLESAKIVLERYHNLKFKFAGSWWARQNDVKEYALRFIKENNIEDSIDFVGFLVNEDKVRFLLETDIFVFPTHFDSFGLVILEAMATGCPVVSTKVGAIPEIIRDNETGILVEPENPAALAEAIIKLVENPSLRKKMGLAGRKRYEECFTLDRHIDRLISVMNRILER